jgi:Phytanoyl-CoA dioxygenase (PhyH)
MVGNEDAAALRTDGFVVLRRAFDAERLSAEVDAALSDGHRDAPLNTGTAGNRFRYVPMMCERTPVSVALADALAGPAATFLRRAVIPVRAKGTRYAGATAWHRDSELDVATIGFVAYLEPLTVDRGALRVLPGSHRGRTTESPTGLPDEDRVVGRALETEPGDVIVFDERLWHGSAGGVERRQWRTDFVPDPVTPEEEAQMRGYFAGIFQPGWDGGYDVDRYPSYGAHWSASHPQWTDRLRDLGAIERAEREESAVRAKRDG